MTTSEVAAYLRVKERTVYELVRTERIPCTRVTGKWLFPKTLIDLWLARGVAGDAALPQPPPVVAGSHDPLLDWALRESGCGLAFLPEGSGAGLRRLAERGAVAAGLHILDAETRGYNVAALRGAVGLGDVVLIGWAWRQEGLVTAPGNPLGLASLADVAARRARVVGRQEGAGAQILLRHLAGAAGIDMAALNLLPRPASTGSDLAAPILDGRADCGIAVAAVARRFRLGFVPLQRERFDLAVHRRAYFEPQFQALLAFAHGADCAAMAADMTGYDQSCLGQVMWNA
ncbi:MAG: helix-turn-helix transcriptional regulator [Alphaproteobacteria bacterium]|nr:helix-turn-helix transcriptional regulator [Alphaproteobacteria bacterium]